MTRSHREQRFHILSILFAMAPIAFALIRAFRSHYDLRMLWMALAAFVGATLVMTLGGVRRRGTRGIVVLGIGALIVAMLAAGWIAMRLGATAAAGIWPVSFVLSVCWVASFVLDTLSRPRNPQPARA